MWIYDTGIVRFRIQGGTEVSATLPALQADGNNWHHIAVSWTRSGSQVKSRIYLDGELTESKTGPWVDPGNTLFLGGGNSGNDAGIGMWDEVYLYDHAVDPSEIRWLARQVLNVEPKLLMISEGSEGVLNLKLEFPAEYEPGSQVQVKISGDELIAFDGQPAGMGRTLIFLPGQLDELRTVRVVPVDDLENQETRIAQLYISVTSTDPEWQGMNGTSVSVVVTDDDPVCGDWGYYSMDLNQDCFVDLRDLLDFALQWLACTDPAFGDCRQPNRYLIANVAHRGYSAQNPENTIASSLACRGFADMVEFDVRTDAGGELVVMHDNTVDRTTDGAYTGPIENLTRDQWSTLDAGTWFDPQYAGEPVPTIQEIILACHPDMIAFVERKTGTVDQYVDIFRKLRVNDKLMVIAFDWNFLEQLEQVMPDIITGALGSDELTIESIQAIQAKGIDFIDWAHSTVTADTVKLVEALGSELWVWTVNDESRMRQLVEYGVKGITTDNPELLKNVLKDMNQR